jgi:hypothetical protein
VSARIANLRGGTSQTGEHLALLHLAHGDGRRERVLDLGVPAAVKRANGTWERAVQSASQIS